jgi:beta-lactam-binding protein with PASTA domain
MPRTEEQIQELVREMYMTAESADWDLDPETLRAQRGRRGVPLPDMKVVVLVAAAVILIVVGIVVASGTPARRSVASGPTTTGSTFAPGDTVTVVDVLNRSVPQATTTIENSGLHVTTTVVANNAPSGSVLAQNPAPGSLVSRGSVVSLTVSSGPPDVRVPNVVGLSQTEAGSVLGQAGLNVGNIGLSPSSNVGAGRVIGSSPSPGTSVMPGSSIDLVISMGPLPQG